MKQIAPADRGDPSRSGAAAKSHRVARAICAGQLTAEVGR
jgi:hypothetical protein